ncbi:class I SAM-dependent methyltransferase [Dongia sp.]|uniref:class I SAM-dependent methyltransferase n=1 Tax=Dongia sp. TaxID=1977262 RepID=UPI003750028D
MPAVAAAIDLGWESSGGLERRSYPSYELYAEHQKAKLGDKRGLAFYDPRLIEALQPRLAALALKPASAVLCLGARSGAECKAFIALGHFAIGIDLNPGQENRYVMVGDFHDLQFADASVDVIYTNALDHAFDLPRILAEVRRVLKPDGRFIADLVDPGERGPGDFESIWWSSIDAVIAEIAKGGFSLVLRSGFETPWRGVQAVFAPSA